MSEHIPPHLLQQRLIIVTGLSGAGKTSVMRSLEDLGYYCVDNLPLPLLPAFLNLAAQTPTTMRKVAIGIDARSEHFLHEVPSTINRIKNNQLSNAKILFLNASTTTLLRRFQETRRRHPLAHGIDIVGAIDKERLLLKPIIDIADIVLDTNNLTIHEIRHWTRTIFSDEEQQTLFVQFISFGFKHGVPQESNIVCDIRFLPNPYFIPELRDKNGKSLIIHDFLFKHQVVNDYWSHLTNFLRYSLQKLYEEGRFFASVAIGCTGGKHRSVAFVEKLNIEQWPHIVSMVHHRDLGKEE